MVHPPLLPAQHHLALCLLLLWFITQCRGTLGDTQLHVSLSNKQRDIINFCSVPRTTTEIMERLGLSNQTKKRERYITSLVAAGYLQMTNPENPKASNQKYKKVTRK